MTNVVNFRNRKAGGAGDGDRQFMLCHDCGDDSVFFPLIDSRAGVVTVVGLLCVGPACIGHEGSYVELVRGVVQE